MKKTFKDLIHEDLNVFFNFNEFGEMHELDGTPTLIVLDDEGSKELSGTIEMENTMRGIFQETLTIYVKSADYEKPDVGYRLNLDGKDYYVTSASKSSGLLRIDLVSYEG